MAGIPPILQQLGKNNIQQMLQPVKQMMNMVRTAQNPQLALNQLATSNPLLKQAMDLTQQYGGDSIKALTETSKQMGIDPNEIMNLMKGHLI